MKKVDIICTLVAILIIIAAFVVSICCFCSINDQREASDNVILIGAGVAVPVLTLYLTLDFKTPNSKT